MTDVDGFDLLTSDLDRLEGVRDYALHDDGDLTKVRVYLHDGRIFMLTAEELK